MTKATRPLLLKVMKQGTKWIVKSSRVINGWTVDDTPTNKAKAVAAAFRYAKKFSPSKVRIYTATGRMQVESEW